MIKISNLDLNTQEGRNEALQRLLEAGKEMAINDAINAVEGESDNARPSERIAMAGEFLRAVDRYEEKLNSPNPEMQRAPSREHVDNYEMEFLIDNWMPADRLTLLTGPGGVGKSYLALQYVCGLAMGIADHALVPYHGSVEGMYQDRPHAFRKEPIKVVVASYEEGLDDTWKRIAHICDSLGWADYDSLAKQIEFTDLKTFGPIWGVDQGAHLATRAKLLELGKWLFDQCESSGASLLMLDPSAAAFGASEIARESVREFCSYLNGWGQQVNCATLLIAHPPKSGDDYSGSTDWQGSCRSLWTLRVESETNSTGKPKETSQWYQLTNVKRNYAAPQPEVYLEKLPNNNKGCSPIWVRSNDKADAQEFYSDYNNPQPRKDNDNDSDSTEGYNVDF